VEHMNLIAKLRQFWTVQLRLQQLYIDRHDVSGGDALDALMIREWARATGPER
jgi:hypothetical protein